MRGTLHQGVVERVHQRIIPADAGNTCRCIYCRCSCRDHPRGCGEHCHCASTSADEPGSSPRMRGTLHMDVPNTSIWRIIPADAGNTSKPCGRRSRVRDHPRGCGEHHTTRPRGLSSGRIIPADAGNTGTMGTILPVREDHPRGCGEHEDPSRSGQDRRGSSPRMRGTHHWCGVRADATRIIPADAGNTWRSPGTSRSAWDHPRGCGEHT